MANEKREHHVTPAGKVLWMSVNEARKSEYSDKAYRSIRVEYDTKEPGVTEFRDSLLNINKRLVGPGEDSKYQCPAGCFTVNFKTEYEPKITDDQGNLIEEQLPTFTKGSTGRVMVSYTTFQGKKAGQGGVNLTGIAILSLDINPTEETQVSKATSSLREALANVKKS